MFIGIDFDNTIIQYDDLFYRHALNKKLIPETLARDKVAVRDYLRSKNIENEWTVIQGEVYGSRIMDAKPFCSVVEVLTELKNLGIPLRIISHKTRFPYLGPKVDLHDSALKWLKSQGFLGPSGLGLSEDDVFFELKIEDKIDRIISCGCTHFIDDLPEVLQLLPNRISKVLFQAKHIKEDQYNWLILNAWKQLPAVLELR
jgi:hypothetical protein